ncbi:MAG: DUF3387 domain-containing protein [Euryarchaeota archaeon]|nr:DUF3387 domain-containing protein [Euryarchaeota archaeon]
MARELVDTIRNNPTIEWTLRERVQAKLRVIVKRILRKYGYPPTSIRMRQRPCWNRQR